MSLGETLFGAALLAGVAVVIAALGASAVVLSLVSA
jgi:hypothetical protein